MWLPRLDYLARPLPFLIPPAHLRVLFHLSPLWLESPLPGLAWATCPHPHIPPAGPLLHAALLKVLPHIDSEITFCQENSEACLDQDKCPIHDWADHASKPRFSRAKLPAPDTTDSVIPPSLVADKIHRLHAIYLRMSRFLCPLPILRHLLVFGVRFVITPAYSPGHTLDTYPFET